MDSDVRVWDTTTNECIRTLKDPYGSIDILSVSAGINVVYAGARDGGVRVWNVQTGKCVKVLGIAAPAKDSTVPSSESEEGEAEYVHPSEARSAAATDSRDAVAALNPSSSNTNNEPSTLPALVDAVVGTVQRRASFILSSASQTFFGTGDSNTNNNYGNKPSAVRTVSIGLLPGQVFSAGDDAIIYEWDVKSGNIVRKYDNHSAGILWVSVEKPVEGETSFSTGRLYSASLDGCVRVFEIDADADEEIESTTQKPRNLSPFQDSTTPHDPTAASTIATLRAQLERAHALLSTQSQLTHRLKSELTVTRSHIATVKNELHQRTAEVATLKSTGLEDRVKRLEREARDGRDAALVALEYITRQGSMVGLEIEAEVMGVMRLLESPWTPLIMNGGEGLESGVGVKPVKRVWESDSEFDSDVDAEREIDEADAWWRADILKVVEHVGSVSSNSQQQQQQQVQQQQVGHQRVVGFRESTYESAYTSSDEDASSEQSTEDESNVLLPPTARRTRKGSARHRWSTMSLTRPVLAYHESFNKRNSISILDIDSSDDTEEDELIQSISRRSSYSSPVPFPPPPPRPMSSSTFSRGFLERIPEDDDYLDAQIEGLGGEIHAIGGAIGRRGAGDTIDMIALTDVDSMSSVNGDVKSPVFEAGELQQEQQQQQVADVVDRGLDYVQLEGLGGLSKSVFSGHGEEDSGDEVASVKPSQAFVMDEDLESVMWQGSVKSSTRAIPKLSTSLKQSSSLKQTAVWEGNGAKIAEQVVRSPTQQSGFGDFAKIPLPEPVTEASGFFSGILKPIVEAAKTPVPPPQPTPAEALKPDPKDQVKKMNSLSWFATGPIAEQQQQQEQPYTRPTASSSWFNAAVDDEEKKKPIPPNNVKPKASSNWFTAALTGSAVEEEEEMAMFDVSNNPPVRPNPPSQVKPKASSSWFAPITNIFQAIADLVPEEEEASLQVANSTTETLFETTDFDGKKWQKSEPAPASVTLASATAGGKKERPSSFIRPARPASVIKKRPTSLLHPRPDSSMSIHVESVVEFDEEVKAPVQVPIPAPVQAVERPSRRVLPPAAVSDKNASSIKKTGRRCKSLDTRPAVTAPTFNRSRRHSISIADETLRQEIKPTFLAGIPQRNSVPSTLTAQAPVAITSPVQIDDSASESSSSHRSHLSTPPLLSDEEHILRDRPLTPSRRTTSAVPTAASPTNNNRIKKRGSVSSSLHSDYVAPAAPQTNRRKSSFKPLAYDSGITEDSPKVDQLAAAFENVMEAAIETPWHLVPKWLVIDEGEGGAAAAAAQEEEQQHGDVVVIEG
ncbi:hypothetical protein HDU99_000774 [Rhizoclosmatium hyalinum]|nr:hypothetical protein HDU99_000774 [Rhizoclosmatium hyalinum]